MASPTLRSGVYYFRKVVPEKLRPLVGMREVKVSLGTGDLTMATRLYAREAKRVAAAWAELQAVQVDKPIRKTASATPREISAWAGEMYRRMVKAHAEDPGSPAQWRKELMALQQALPVREREPGVKQQWPGSWAFAPRQIASHIVGNQVKAFLFEERLALNANDRRELCFRAASALGQAYRLLERRAYGDYGPDPLEDRFPRVIDSTPWMEHYEKYCDDHLPGASSRKRQEGVLRHFFAFVEDDRPDAITVEDAIRWKEKRLGEVARDTVRKADLAHPRAFFAWCASTGKIALNPFEKVSVAGGKKRKKKDAKTGEVEAVLPMREYTLAEARMVLKATLDELAGRPSEETRATIRWVPWLCAYTGARVNEITQLRAEDIRQEPSRDETQLIWVVRITPEAGTVKDDEPRSVALHPHLLEQGFLRYVQSRQGLHLFYNPERRRGGSRANPQFVKAGERLARWVRHTVRIKDPQIAPNHAWRHLFRSTLLAGEVQEQVIDGIDGHAPSTEGRKYGKSGLRLVFEPCHAFLLIALMKGMRSSPN